MNLSTEAFITAAASGVFDSTDTSEEERATDQLLQAGFTPEQARAIIIAIHACTGSTPRTSANTPPPTKETALDRRITRLTDSFIPLAILATAVVAVVGIALFASS